MVGSTQDTYTIDPAIARFASDIGLDSASTQALAASISNQSTRMMPAPELDSNNSAMPLSLNAAGMQQLQQQQQQQQQQLPLQAQIPHQPQAPPQPGSAQFPGSLMMQNAASNHMFAVAAAMNHPQHQQYAATQLAFASQAPGQPLNLANVPSLPTVPSMSAAHMGSSQPIDQIMADSQRQPSVSSGAAANIPRPVPSNVYDYRVHNYLPDNAKR
ncbi:hypothetical protein IWW50_006650 [Coemansia erecta]|nr:hypothetical protein IWW50_006650 [Coemansia erecta]